MREDVLPIEAMDRDGAVAEATEALHGPGGRSRREVLTRGGVLVGAGVALGGIPLALAVAQGGGLSKGDKEILNYALTLEYLEAAFYQQALNKGELRGEVLNFAQVVAAHEAAHVDALVATLGDSAVKKPRFDFQGTTGKDKFLATAQTLEDTGVSAYQGQTDKIKAPAVLMAAASILSIEARHAGWVRDIRDNEDISPAPDAFEKAKTMKQVLDAVDETGFIK